VLFVGNFTDLAPLSVGDSPHPFDGKMGIFGDLIDIRVDLAKNFILAFKIHPP
jgi:hypothetical protein